MSQKLPKHHSGQVRTTLPISISVPVELEDAMNRAAVRRGMNRSQYVVWLVRQHLYLEHGQLPPATFADPLPPIPNAPSRIKKRKTS